MLLRRMPRTIAGTAIFVTLFGLLAGSRFIFSLVPGAPADSPRVEAPLRAGIYCPVNRDGSVASQRQACTRNWIDDGRFHTAPQGAADGTGAVMELAQLSRGAALMQVPPGVFSAEEDGYQFAVALFREDSFVLTPIVELTDRDREEARSLGIGFIEDRSTGDFRITRGKPAAVRAWMAYLVEEQFYRAALQPELYDLMTLTSLVVVRVASLDEPDKRAPNAQLAASAEAARAGLAETINR